MTAPEDSASSNKEAPDQLDEQTRREHLQMIAAAGVAAASSVDSSPGAGLDDGDNTIWRYDNPLTVEPSLGVQTPIATIDATSANFDPSDLKVRGWGCENEILLSVDGDYKYGSVKPALTLDRETARDLAKRLLETAQWLETFQEERPDV
jgi:hypothetical protein